MTKKIVIIATALLAAVGCNSSSHLEAEIAARDGNQGPVGDTGPGGEAGPVGSNGHSQVSMVREASHCECQNSGFRMDFYIDSDDSLSVTEGDLYSNSIIVCNGSNGQQGVAGLPGSAGSVGATGPAGADGQVGPQGPQGPAGIQGPAGVAGSDGIQGPVGPAGSPGPQGPAGGAGGVGPQGPQGPAGSSGATIVAYPATSCTLITGTTTYVKASGSNYKLYTSSSCASSSAFAEVSQGEAYWASSNTLATWSSTALRAITYN